MTPLHFRFLTCKVGKILCTSKGCKKMTENVLKLLPPGLYSGKGIIVVKSALSSQIPCLGLAWHVSVCKSISFP